jgi:hypothetical protein
MAVGAFPPSVWLPSLSATIGRVGFAFPLRRQGCFLFLPSTVRLPSIFAFVGKAVFALATGQCLSSPCGGALGTRSNMAALHKFTSSPCGGATVALLKMASSLPWLPQHFSFTFFASNKANSISPYTHFSSKALAHHFFPLSLSEFFDLPLDIGHKLRSDVHASFLLAAILWTIFLRQCATLCPYVPE